MCVCDGAHTFRRNADHHTHTHSRARAADLQIINTNTLRVCSAVNDARRPRAVVSVSARARAHGARYIYNNKRAICMRGMYGAVLISLINRYK